MLKPCEGPRIDTIHPRESRAHPVSALPSILRHSSPDEDGLTRRRRGRGFSYHYSDGRPVKAKRTLERIASLGLPPAYRDVWICRDEHGHLQACGTDDAGRRQYRYHPEWRAFRDRLKFDQLEDFGRALPRLRRRVEADLRRNRPDRDQAAAALVRLLDDAAFRIGSDAYARDNKTFGATTLRSRHLKMDGDTLRFDFRAKGGKRVRTQIKDRTLARVLERVDDLRGWELFTYLDDADEVRRLRSHDVNDYIADTMGVDGVSAKTFRTWRGSVCALDCAWEAGRDLTIKAMSERAAAVLHNTPAIARDSYIHPEVIGLAEMEAPARRERLDRLDLRRAPNDLPAQEKRFLALLSG